MKLSRLTISILVGLAIGTTIFIIVLGQEKKTVETPWGSKSIQQTPTLLPVKLLTWTDQAGFTFKYPEGLTVNRHDEDNDNYAHLEFTSKDHPGNLIVWAKDTNEDLSSWIKNDKRFKDSSVIDMTFAGQGGKKIFLATPSAMLVTGTIDQAILFMIETNLVDKGFWDKVHETIAGSFALTPDSFGQNGGSNAASANGLVDEEETLQ